MTLAMTSSGQGPAVVFLHGWALSGRVWRSLTQRLSDDMCCYCVDLPGHGGSGDVGGGLDAWADTVVATVGRPAIYVGWSLGGLVALEAARRYPTQVRGLGLIATLARMVRGADWSWGLQPAAIEAIRHGLARNPALTLNELFTQQVLGEPGAAGVARQLQDELVSWLPGAAGLEQGLDILCAADLRASLAALQMPALLVAGGRDRIAHPEGMAWMAERMPNASYWRIEHAAHAPFISNERHLAERLHGFVAGNKTMDCTE